MNAVFKLKGYYIPRNGELLHIAFERGKAELVAALKKDIENIESIIFEQFMNWKKL